MDADRWSLVKDRFVEALALDAPAQARLLATLDDATRSEVEALLRDAEANGVLDAPLDSALLPTGVEAAPDRPPADHAPEADGPGPLAGARVGPYRIDARIGRGGMGDVYRAHRDDGLFQREVALKVVRRGADTEAVLARFAAERRILGSLEHTGIARLIAAGAEAEGPAAGQPWLALELVDGAPITEATRTLPLDARLGLLADVAEAVHHAHRQLVVHRDLKPSNVLVTADGRAKLLDFGIAKILDPDADAGLTDLGEVRPMTRAYASPEQIRGQRVTTATDVYGLGLLAFEVLTGTRPFPTDAGRRALEAAILDQDAPLASRAARSEAGGVEAKRLRGDLDVICRTALAKAPSERYASAAALAADLRRVLAHVPIAARPPSAGYRARRFVRRHRLAVAAAAAVVVAIVGGAGVALGQARVARAEAAQSDATAAFLTGLFEGADPTATTGDTLTALALLDRGARRIDAELARAPDTRAALYTVVGTAYLGLGRTDSAAAFARRALALRQPGGRAPDAAEAVRAEVLLGRALFPTAPQRANAAFDDAIARARATRDDEALLDALEAQGTLTGSQVLTPTETVAVLEEAVDLCRGLEGDESPRLGRLLSVLALKVASAHQHGRIEPLLRDALARLPADEAPYDRSTVLISLAETAHMTGQTAEGQRYAEEALALRRRVLGPTDTRLAAALSASAATGAGGPVVAERNAREALGIADRAGDGAEAIDALAALASALDSQGRLDETVEVYRRRFALAGEVYGTESTRYTAASGTYADALHRAERYADAALAWDRAITLSTQAYGPESAVVASLLLSAGITADALRQPSRAAAYFARAYTASRGLGESSRTRAEGALFLGKARLDQGQTAEATRLLREAVASRASMDRPFGGGMATNGHYAAALLGEALLATDAAEGRRLLAAAAPALADSLGADHAQAVRARAALRRAGG